MLLAAGCRLRVSASSFPAPRGAGAQFRAAVVNVYDRDGELAMDWAAKQLLRHRLGPHVHLRLETGEHRAACSRTCARGAALRRAANIDFIMSSAHPRTRIRTSLPAELPGDDGAQRQAARHDGRERRDLT